MSQLPQNEVVQDATRRQMKLVPESAVREVVANSLIHQDFLIGGTSVMIEVYSDRVEVSNPGTPIVEVNRFIDGYQSRNERLADLMRHMRVCEEKGSGIDKVIHAAELFQLPAPQFREEHRRTSVVLAGPKTFDDMDRDDRIRACYQHAGLRRVANDFMTNQSLRERFKLPDTKSATVSQVIAATLEAGLIKTDSSVGASLRLRRYLPYWA
jgi:predicted HTH transcriptional regulator